jgi:hypothetical protein
LTPRTMRQRQPPLPRMSAGREGHRQPVPRRSRNFPTCGIFGREGKPGTYGASEAEHLYVREGDKNVCMHAETPLRFTGMPYRQMLFSGTRLIRMRPIPPRISSDTYGGNVWKQGLQEIRIAAARLSPPTETDAQQSTAAA